MGCRVGMSMNPEERIDYWKQREGHIAGRVIRGNLTYDEAQQLEADEARKHGCVRQAGGERQPGRVWSVYHVWGGTVPNY